MNIFNFLYLFFLVVIYSLLVSIARLSRLSREAGIGDLSLIKKIWRDKKVFALLAVFQQIIKRGNNRL